MFCYSRKGRQFLFLPMSLHDPLQGNRIWACKILVTRFVKFYNHVLSSVSPFFRPVEASLTRTLSNEFSILISLFPPLLLPIFMSLCAPWLEKSSGEGGLTDSYFLQSTKKQERGNLQGYWKSGGENKAEGQQNHRNQIAKRLLEYGKRKMRWKTKS